MKTHRLKLICLLILLALTLAGCAQSVTNDPPQEAKSVDAITLQVESVPIELSYLGTLSSKNLIRQGFATAGKVATVDVSVGQWVDIGQPLATLDTSDFNLALAAAEAQVDMLQAQYNKTLNALNAADQGVVVAEEAYNYAKDQYERLQRLYAQDAVSKQALDQARLQLVQSEATLKQAKSTFDASKTGADSDDAQMVASQLEQAQIALQQRQKAIQDTVLRAEISGHVTTIALREGEFTAAGTPGVIIQDRHLLAVTGVTDRDVQQLQIGQTATAEVGEQLYSGVVTEVGQAPDAQTRTYKLTVDLGTVEQVPIGSVAQITVIVGEEQGIWVPIEAVQSNGEDFVYVVSADQAMKRTVTLGVVDNTRVSVTGLNAGEVLVVSGMSGLSDGDLVTVDQLDGEVQER